MQLTSDRPFVFLGCGNMGEALLQGFLDSGQLRPQDVVVIAPTAQTRAKMEKHNIRSFDSIKSAQNTITAAVYLLAVKPQILDEITKELPLLCDPQTLIVSIAGGKNLCWLQKAFDQHQPTIWAMPNTPVQVRKGVIPYCCNEYVTDGQKTFIKNLFDSSSLSYLIDDVQQMDVLTALSGCGPAWVFLLAEMMSKAAQKHGIAPEFSDQLARQTIIGAAALLEHSEGISAEQLRRNVTSPGGITHEAMEYLQGENGWVRPIMEAFAASVRRSIALAEEKE